MPPVPELGLIARHAVHGHFGDAVWTNIFYTLQTLSGTPTVTDVNDLAAGIRASYRLAFAASMSLNWTLEEVETVFFPTPTTEIVGTGSGSSAGSDSGVDLTANVALRISWPISSHYRGGHPRTYLCGLVTDRLLDVKSWSSATIAEFEADAATFIGDVNGQTTTHFSSVTLGCLRRFANGGSETRPRTYLDPPEFFPINSGIVRPMIGSQRRRVGSR